MRIVEVGLEVLQVYEFTDGEDGKTYLWNATEGLKIASDGREWVSVWPEEAGITKETLKILAPGLDLRKALALPAAALLSPVLFVPHKGKHVLIDGWHRVAKAVWQGFPCLPAWLLTEEEADSIRLEALPWPTR
mgnify:CR=1 FL=1|jgi:hypothetical protein